ncbi:MAG: hypothetical protein K6E33_08575 [Lachnospiraceae bacterium]|nr:hypothetical protein [Lachnospiraceae bacterium]
MRRLLKGDLIRLVRKKSMGLAALSMVLLVIGTVLYGLDQGLYNGYTFMECADEATSIGAFIFGIVTLVGVYGDEFKSMSMSNVIGRGLSRKKIVIAKFLDSLVIMVMLTFVYAVVIFLFSRILGVTLTSLETKALYLDCYLNVVYVVGYILVSSIFLYATGNVPLGIMVYIILSVVVPYILDIFKYSPLMVRFHFNRYFLYSLTSRAYTDILLGMEGSGMMHVLLGAIIYIGGALVISMIIFDRREMDF